MTMKKWILFLFSFFLLISLHQELAFAQDDSDTATATPADTKAPGPDATDSTTAADTTPKTSLVKTITLNDQEWKLDNNQENKDLVLGEYTTNNENVNNWTQLVTYQKFKFTVPTDLTAEKFAETEIDNLKKEGYKPIYKVIESTPKDAIIEFRIEDPQSQQQDELQRIIITPENNLVVLHYVTRKADMGDDARKKWINILKGLDLTTGAGQ